MERQFFTRLAVSDENLLVDQTRSILWEFSSICFLPLQSYNLLARGLLEMVKLLVNHDASLVRVEDRRKRFPIHCACEIGNLEIFQYLVEKAGADIDQIDNQTIARYSQHSNIVWQQVIYECKKSVVLIAVFDKKKDRQVQIGSGFVNQEGLIVTAAHVSQTPKSIYYLYAFIYKSRVF